MLNTASFVLTDVEQTVTNNCWKTNNFRSFVSVPNRLIYLQIISYKLNLCSKRLGRKVGQLKNCFDFLFRG